MSACLLLVRHAQAAFDEDDYDHLSPLGERQAQALAGWWSSAAPARPLRVVGGGLRRHRQTAAPLLAALGAEWSEHAGLAEFDHREIFYRLRPDLLDPAALARWKREPGDHASRFSATWQAALARWMDATHAGDYREPWPRFRARCLAALAELAASLGEGQTLLVFTSSGPIAAALASAWQGGDASFAAIQDCLWNAGISEFWRAGAAAVPGRPGQVNACPHLPADLRSLR